jgi:hypothetical protein
MAAPFPGADEIFLVFSALDIDLELNAIAVKGKSNEGMD